LLGQDELQPILRAPNMEQFRQRIVASCHLAPLIAREAREYIEFRLKHAGYAGEGLFSDDAFVIIHDFSRGVPRRINTLMDRILLYGFLEEIDFFEEEQVNIVIDEVKSEMFVPDKVIPAPDEAINTAPEAFRFTAKGTEIHAAQYYKDMLHELVDALDDALKHKLKLTQYIDKLLKKKYRTYIRLKSDDE
jgi:general secretion pathway protein A